MLLLHCKGATRLLSVWGMDPQQSEAEKQLLAAKTVLAGLKSQWGQKKSQAMWSAARLVANRHGLNLRHVQCVSEVKRVFGAEVALEARENMERMGCLSITKKITEAAMVVRGLLLTVRSRGRKVRNKARQFSLKAGKLAIRMVSKLRSSSEFIIRRICRLAVDLANIAKAIVRIA